MRRESWSWGSRVRKGRCVLMSSKDSFCGVIGFLEV